MAKIEAYKAQLSSHKFHLIDWDTLKEKTLTELCDMLVNEVRYLNYLLIFIYLFNFYLFNHFNFIILQEKALLAAEADVKAHQEHTMDSQTLLAEDIEKTQGILQLANANVHMLKKAITMKKEAIHEQPVWMDSYSVVFIYFFCRLRSIRRRTRTRRSAQLVEKEWKDSRRRICGWDFLCGFCLRFSNLFLTAI